MTGVTHMLAAAAIYELVPDKPLALTVALASHFVLDAIPHYELSKKINYTLGIIGGLFILTMALLNKDAFLLLAAFLGALPDLNTLFFKNRLLLRIHNQIHSKYKVHSKYKRHYPRVSISFELILSTACLLVLTVW